MVYVKESKVKAWLSGDKNEVYAPQEMAELPKLTKSFPADLKAVKLKPKNIKLSWAEIEFGRK